MNKKQSGFGIVEIFLVAILVILVGFVVWQVYMAQTSADKTANDTQQGSNSQVESSKNAGYVVIKEWGVRFKPASGLNASDVTYYDVENNNGISNDLYGLTTKRVEAIGGHCSHSDPGYFVSLASIGRSKTASSTDEQSSVKIGDYYYYAYPAQSACGDDTTTSPNSQIESEDYALLKNSIGTLEAAE